MNASEEGKLKSVVSKWTQVDVRVRGVVKEREGGRCRENTRRTQSKEWSKGVGEERVGEVMREGQVRERVRNEM